jgi:hypothetical protein
MTYIKPGLARAWPEVTTKSGKIRLVRYCYAKAAARDNLPCVLQPGFKIWAAAIGHPASLTNGHCLGWKEIDDENSDKEQRKTSCTTWMTTAAKTNPAHRTSRYQSMLWPSIWLKERPLQALVTILPSPPELVTTTSFWLRTPSQNTSHMRQAQLASLLSHWVLTSLDRPRP